MPIEENGNEYEDAPRWVWEEAISQIRDKAKAGLLTDPEDVKSERSKILEMLLKGLHDRFGN